MLANTGLMMRENPNNRFFMMQKELETRKCIITGEIKPKNELLRFTLLKNGDFIPDFNKKFSGKGIYVSNSKSILEKVFSSY